MLKAGRPGAAASASMRPLEQSERQHGEERSPTHHPSLPAVSALPLPPWAPVDNLWTLCRARCGGVRPETGLPADQVKVRCCQGGRMVLPSLVSPYLYLFYAYLCRKCQIRVSACSDRRELRARHLSPPVPVTALLVPRPACQTGWSFCTCTDNDGLRCGRAQGSLQEEACGRAVGRMRLSCGRQGHVCVPCSQGPALEPTAEHI